MAAADPRLFIALSPPPVVRAAVLGVRDEMFARVGGKPVSAANLHLTLAFLGATPRARVAELQALMADVPFAPMALTLDEVGSFAQAKVVWMGCAARHSGLDALVADLRARLQAAGFTFDAKPFNAHVTLLRKTACETQVAKPVAWLAHQLDLYESVSSADGVVYRLAD